MFTCPVNVCGSPTVFVATSGEIWMFASTYVLTAFGESPVSPSPVVRVRVCPATMTVVEACTVVTPGTALFSVTEHEPVVPTVVQLDGLSWPGPLRIAKLIVVPAGAFTKPSPASTFTCAVKT